MARRAILYLRVSSIRQVDGYSLDVQQEQCREYCQRQGWEIVRIFREEGESAKTLDRTELKKIFAWVKKNPGEVDYLVVYKMSRTSRDVGDYIAMKNRLAKAGVVIKSVSEQIDATTPEGRFFETITAAVNQFDNEVRAEQARSGMRAAAATGRYVWPAPYGYRNGGKAAQESLRIVEEEAVHIRWAYEQVAAGTPVAHVHREIHERGARSRRRGNRFARSYIWTLLKNPTYSGHIECLPWGLATVGDWTPIVSRRLWLRTQEAMKASTTWPKTTRRMVARPEFPLRGHVCCPCGRKYTASLSRSRSGARYAYYHCPGCSSRVRGEKLEGDFVSLLRSCRPHQAILEAWRGVVGMKMAERTKRAVDSESSLRRQLRSVEAKKDRLLDLFLEGGLPKAAFEAKSAQLTEEARRLEADLLESSNRPDVGQILEGAHRFLKNFPDSWELGNLDARTSLQNLIFPKGVCYCPDSGFSNRDRPCLFNDLGTNRLDGSSMVGRIGLEPMTRGLKVRCSTN